MIKALLLITFFSANVYSIDLYSPGPTQLRNADIGSYSDMNSILKKLNLSSCLKTHKENNTVENRWKLLLDYWGIQPCDPVQKKSVGQSLGGSIPATQSGILNDKGKNGERTVFKITQEDCNHQLYSISMTYDRVITDKGPICGFEVFIKTPDNRFVGVALDKNGKVLKEVPEELAFDKHLNKFKDKKSTKIKSGVGCFECHPTVSHDYQMEEAADFWSIKPLDLQRHAPRNITTDRHGDTHSTIK